MKLRTCAEEKGIRGEALEE
jgi:hypothetical protein